MDIKCTGEALDPKTNSPAPQLGCEGIWAADGKGETWLTRAQPGRLQARSGGGCSGLAGPYLAGDAPHAGSPGPRPQGGSLTTAPAPALPGIPAERERRAPGVPGASPHRQLPSPCRDSNPTLCLPWLSHNPGGTYTELLSQELGGGAGDTGKMWGERCKDLKIVCHPRHRGHPDGDPCLQGLYSIHPASPAPDWSLHTCSETCAHFRMNICRGVASVPPRNLQGGARTPGDHAETQPARALRGAQHILSCHQFLIYWIQEKITTAARRGEGGSGGWERGGIRSW